MSMFDYLENGQADQPAMEFYRTPDLPSVGKFTKVRVECVVFFPKCDASQVREPALRKILQRLIGDNVQPARYGVRVEFRSLPANRQGIVNAAPLGLSRRFRCHSFTVAVQ
jgi:hypothetical protein